MDVAFILDRYFKGMADVSIDVFDAQTLNAVYRDVINAMTSHFEIEVSVLQALSYCLYEMMDNVHIHSGKPLGTAPCQTCFLRWCNNALRGPVNGTEACSGGQGLW